MFFFGVPFSSVHNMYYYHSKVCQSNNFIAFLLVNVRCVDFIYLNFYSSFFFYSWALRVQVEECFVIIARLQFIQPDLIHQDFRRLTIHLLQPIHVSTLFSDKNISVYHRRLSTEYKHIQYKCGRLCAVWRMEHANFIGHKWHALHELEEYKHLTQMKLFHNFNY